MDTNGDSHSVEPMRLTEAEAYVYEAIATLEYLGRPVTPAEIEVVADQADPEETSRILRGLAGRGLIEEQDGPAYRLARQARPVAAPDDEPGAV